MKDSGWEDYKFPFNPEEVYPTPCGHEEALQANWKGEPWICSQCQVAWVNWNFGSENDGRD